MSRPHRRAAAACAALLAGLLLAGCGGSSTPSASPTGTQKPTKSPRPTAEVVKAGKSCRAQVGEPVALRLPGGSAVVRIDPKRAQTYTGRLASYSSAYPPSYGYFVKIPVKLTDLGPSTWRIDPEAFVLEAGGRDLTVNDGNGPFSGASHVILATFLDKGQSERTNIVIDSPAAHGSLTYRYKGKLACAWTF